MKTAIAAALLICMAGTLHADLLYPDALTFGPSYAIGPPVGFPLWAFPAPGEPMAIAGVVSDVDAPFLDLLPLAPYEVTFVLAGAMCAGTGHWDDFVCAGGEYAEFHSGVLTVYLDTTPDAAFGDVSTFSDGEPVLIAETPFIYATDNDPWEVCPMREDEPDVLIGMTFIGGSWFSRVSSGGTGFQGNGDGETNRHDVVPPALLALGWVVRIDGTIDIVGPVATKPATWGLVKSLYR